MSQNAVFPYSGNKFSHCQPNKISVYGFICRPAIANSYIRIQPYASGSGKRIVCVNQAALGALDMSFARLSETPLNSRVDLI